jgi:hypothetical protein
MEFRGMDASIISIEVPNNNELKSRMLEEWYGFIIPMFGKKF